MGYDVPDYDGENHQRKELFYRRIVAAFPERENDVSLIYGNPELEYYRLVNAGLISDTGGTAIRGTIWFTGVGPPGEISGSTAGDKYLDTASGDIYTLQ